MPANDSDIPAFLDRRPLILTYTILNTYRNVCPHQMFRRYIKRDQNFVETPEMKYGNEVHTAFEHRVGAGKPLPDAMRQWEPFAAAFDGREAKTEKKLAVKENGTSADYWAKDIYLRGKIDAHAIHGDTAFIADWKTGGSKYEDPFELEVGAVLLKLNHRHLTKIKGKYIWLKEDRAGQLYDLSDFRKTWDEINRLAGLIMADKQSGEFEKRKSGLCGFCSVADCENHYVARK